VTDTLHAFVILTLLRCTFRCRRRRYAPCQCGFDVAAVGWRDLVADPVESLACIALEDAARADLVEPAILVTTGNFSIFGGLPSSADAGVAVTSKDGPDS
jgi:hypothetical protein